MDGTHDGAPGIVVVVVPPAATPAGPQPPAAGPQPTRRRLRPCDGGNKGRGSECGD